jgi:hypothetical protein
VESDQSDKNWKLELRYGKRQTAYRHYTAIAEGVVGELPDGFSCRPGNAFMGMKTWALSPDESADMIRVIGKQIGFSITGKVYAYDTEPSQPPREDAYGYDITFTPFESEPQEEN